MCILFKDIKFKQVHRHILIAAILAGFTFFGYFTTTGFDFVSFDDYLHLHQNPNLKKISKEGLLAIWKKPYQYMYAPVSYTAWAALSLVSRMGDAKKPFDPFIFHAANIMLHLLNVLLVYGIVWVLVRKDWPAAAGALIFSLHPVQVESVAWVSEFRGLLSAAFGLGAVLLFLLETRGELCAGKTPGRASSMGFLAVATVFFLCALLTKPSAIMIPLVAGAIALPSVKRRHSIIILAGWIAIALPIVFMTGTVQGVHNALPLWQRPFVFFDAIGFYISKIAFPASLCIDYGRTPSAVMQNLSWLPMTALASVIAAVAILAGKRIPLVQRAFLVFTAALLPVSGLVPFLFQCFSTVADRYLYVPMLGVALGVAAILSALPRPPVVAVLGSWLIGAAAAGQYQLPFWRTSADLYTHTLEVNAGSVLSLNNLGNLFFDNGNLKSALLLYKKAIIKKPDFGEAYYNCAKVFAETGDFRNAINYCAFSLYYFPAHTQTYAMLGIIYSRVGKYQTAIANFKHAMALGDSSYNVCVNLGLLYKKENQHDSACGYFLLAAASSNRPWEQYNNAALECLMSGEKNKAILYLSKAVDCNPREVYARLNRGIVLEELGRIREAEKDFLDVLAMDPVNPDAKAHLAKLNAGNGAR